VNHGFQIVPDLFAPSELRPLFDVASQVGRGRAGARHLLRQSMVRAVANDPRLARLAGSVVGRSAQPFKATLFDKSPTSNWLVTWHQDLALPLARRVEAPGWGPWTRKRGQLYALAPAEALEQVVALRLHLDDSTLENGPLRVLAGTHRDGRLSEQQIAERVATATPIDCVVPSGGVIVMRPLVLHASSKSTSAMPRRVLHIEYAATVTLGSGIELAVA
jgi:hypothetical protein